MNAAEQQDLTIMMHKRCGRSAVASLTGHTRLDSGYHCMPRLRPLQTPPHRCDACSIEAVSTIDCQQGGEQTDREGNQPRESSSCASLTDKERTAAPSHRPVRLYSKLIGSMLHVHGSNASVSSILFAALLNVSVQVFCWRMAQHRV
jgi:hypothetical protein